MPLYTVGFTWLTISELPIEYGGDNCVVKFNVTLDPVVLIPMIANGATSALTFSVIRLIFPNIKGSSLS